MTDRLDATKIEQLRGWAVKLAADGNQELRAAGKAILLLIEEIERPRVADPPEQPAQQPVGDGGDDLGEQGLDRTLRSRLSRIRDRKAPSL